MGIKDIVNRDLINLTNCESEPIHIPGSIQPHGFALALRQPDFRIEFCSANTADYIGAAPEALLGKPLSALLSPDETDSFSRYMERFVSAAHPHTSQIGDTSYNTTVHLTDDLILLEFEPFPDGRLELPNLYTQTRNFISFIESANYLQDLCQSVATETRAITGYDRVMIYRFDSEYNGEVFAESCREDLEPFLGYRYPHTDIPAQARALYMRNLLRIIVDVNYEPVPMLTLSSRADHASLDMSHSVLRSVSPIHIEYLKNMGVGATLTISLMYNGMLWGLIACHHYSPKNLPHYRRLAAQLQGHFLTSQISVREVKEEYDLSRRSEGHLQELQAQLLSNPDFILQSTGNRHLLDIVSATGVVIVNEGVPYSQGAVPEERQLRPLLDWLAQHVREGVFSTDHLAAHYPPAAEMAGVTAGVIYHSLGKDGSDCILWFRPEVVQDLNWAGDPNKAVLKGEDGMRLTPRKSFALWRERVRYRSLPWKRPELNAAASFAYALQKQILFQYLSKEEERYRKLSEKLREVNEELANINWISTHDLKEPLRKIQIFGSRIIKLHKDGLSQPVADGVERMRSSANRMQRLLDDILVYSGLNTREEAFAPVNLNEVLQEVCQEFQDELSRDHVRIDIDPLPEIRGIRFQLHQLFTNLMSNALKFARTEEPLTIRVKCRRETDRMAGDKHIYFNISFADNGIGFDDKYAARIFDVFQRLHTAKQYSGTGIGLAICRKVMTNHNGYIRATGVQGEGTTFQLYFPADPASAQPAAGS